MNDWCRSKGGGKLRRMYRLVSKGLATKIGSTVITVSRHGADLFMSKYRKMFALPDGIVSITSARAAKLLIVIAVFAAGEWSSGSLAIAQSPDEAAIRPNLSGRFPYPQRIPAPSLAGGAGWVNVAQPIELEDLRGRFVLLDFWTYCCINCMHVLPELKQLERAFPNELVILGIHSAKFTGEEEEQNIREAAERYEIEHPILNDAGLTIWRRYGVQSWPTLVLIDPAGDVVWAAGGERKFAELKAVIERGLPFYRAQGLLKPAPRPVLITDNLQNRSPLRFPGKVLADEASGRLFIADSNHHRIVVAKLDGSLDFVIGSGIAGRTDGPFDECRFQHPQGIALVGEKLYIADTENHLLRKADFATRHVTTIAGTGQRGDGWPGSFKKQGRLPKSTAIASPWALWPHRGHLYIAMAGSHQIWRMTLDEKRIDPYAGNGQENIVDGPLLPRRPYEPGFASFAQPSGLTSDGKWLYVADSEGSVIRAVPFDPRGRVETPVGPTATLFDFGDLDGAGSDVRLQHPLGVAFTDGKLYVADTYNNKIKIIDVAEQSCRTIAGSGRPGKDDGDNGLQATLNEPGGLSAAGGRLFVADTNNHLIRVVDLTAPYVVSTLKIEGLARPALP